MGSSLQTYTFTSPPLHSSHRGFLALLKHISSILFGDSENTLHYFQWLIS